MCGGIVDAAAAFSSSEAPLQQQGQVLGRLQSAVAAGALFGPLMGGGLVSIWGFRPVLLAMGLLTIASAIAAWIYLQEQHYKSSSIPAKVPPAGIGQTFVSLLEKPQTRAFIMAGIGAKLGVFGLVSIFAPFVKVSTQSATAEEAATWVGMLQAVTWSATFLGAGWWGCQNDRHSVEKNYGWASLGCGVSVALQPLFPQLRSLLLLRVVQGFCFSALEQSIFLVVARTSNAQNRGVRIGATQSLLIIGQILGAFSSVILGNFLNTYGLFIAMGLAFFIGAGWVWFIPKTSD